MNRENSGLWLIVLLCGGMTLVGCSSDESNPLRAFEPEIVNDADAFQFQITGASNVSTTVSYSWTNTGTQATINHSTITTDGSAEVHLFDADSAPVYSETLAASLNEASTSGAAGVWTVRVEFTDFSGTANFRVEKL